MEVMKEHFSPAYLGPFHPSSLSWTESGYLLDKLPVSDIAAFTDGRPFELAETNPRVSVEWAGYPRTGRPGVAMAQPSQQTLARAETLFSSSHARSIIQVGDGRELTIANFRPVELAPETTVTASTIPSPPGCRRALLFLSESSSIVVADTIGNVLVQKSVRVGAIAVWDPKRIAIFAKSRTTPIRVIEIMLMPRHRAYPFRVAWTGLNDWPADPFHYTVGDIPASPPFETDLVRERP
jgi:hypothetical protein